MICSYPECTAKLAPQNRDGYCPKHRHIGRRKPQPVKREGTRQILITNTIPGCSVAEGTKTAVSVSQEPWA